MSDEHFHTDSRSARKTAHIIDGTTERYGRTYARARCGVYIWPENLREPIGGAPRCRRCQSLTPSLRGQHAAHYDPAREVAVVIPIALAESVAHGDWTAERLAVVDSAILAALAAAPREEQQSNHECMACAKPAAVEASR